MLGDVHERAGPGLDLHRSPRPSIAHKGDPPLIDGHFPGGAQVPVLSASSSIANR
jgi:hypothetical protein